MADAVFRAPGRPQHSAWHVYSRLLTYAWRYKARLVVALMLALFIAASFGGMLMSIGGVVKVTLYDPGQSMGKPDPAQEYAAKIVSATGRVERTIGWAPKGWDQRLLRLVDTMREQKIRALTAICVIAIVVAFLVGVARFFQEYLAGSVGAFITTDLECAMYENVVRQSMGFFEAHSSGEILARFTNDVFMISRGLTDVFVKLLREPFKAITLFLVAVSVDFWLALIGVCVLPPVFYLLLLIGKKMRKAARRSLEKIASLVSVVNETFKGIMIVKGYTMEEYEIARIHAAVLKLRRYLLRLVRLDAATDPLTEFLLIAGIVVFVLISGQRVVRGQLDLGGLTEIYLALGFMLDPMRKLSNVNNAIQRSVASAERVFEYVDLKPTIVERSNAVAIAPLRESLRFDNVRFAYDGTTEVLKGIDIDIKKGEMVALVGFSGAGKSTFAKLIPRFYDVTGGAITIDGVDIRDATFRSLRDQISIVTQETILFAESVRDNIAFGRTAYTDDRIREAASAAHATEFVDRLPQGFATLLSEAGSTLSGGQRQRLAIARAIIKDPSILILDEATSSLDSESERLIQEALDEFVTGRTAIVIAHRLSTIQRADRIVVMEDGRIVEQGTHAELLARGGIYKRLYDTQFGALTES